MTGAPNFAFEHCLKSISDEDMQSLDLSRLELIFCGAERVLPSTLARFAARFQKAGLRRDVFLPACSVVTAAQPPGTNQAWSEPRQASMSCG